ncbi:DUF692 domain-containing protein (plasmid) [Pseudorhodobacter turbinis]|uniref:UPF0276 protein EOK75_19370 n=1 Tax=Pseudorhodobacter turbinis TaxID=2500533 RepID=A0A4P8EL88_9RHOB|nr:DUF692 domain-containing protein [Pseudorhodobacter turbinis]QCO57826.1 DUF692 domain-containing protein [Pseudorhodobacter turbinis]
MINALPNTAGVGFKSEHFSDLVTPGAVGWLEIHAENYMLDGGPRLAMLRDLATRFAISVHGVGLSIGGMAALDRDHLARLRHLVDWLNPASFSEHLAWSTHEGAYFNDLLPLPYTAETLALVSAHVDQVQQVLGRKMLLENPSSYLRFTESTLSETDFLAAVVDRTGCGLLLDVNNVFISATNLGLDPRDYIADFPLEAVGEIHLGGHDAQIDNAGTPVLIDTHGAPVADPVWQLYGDVIALTGPRPTLIEWDNDVPPFAVLEAEAARAATLLQGRKAA